MTEYDLWGESGPGKPDGSFKGQLFSAYAQANEEEQDALNRAFPELFVNDPEESEAANNREAELNRLENLFGEKIRKDTILAQLTQQREDRVKAICERFLTTEAADIPDDFIEYMLDVLDQDDELSPDEEEAFDYFNTLYNGAK